MTGDLALGVIVIALAVVIVAWAVAAYLGPGG